KVQSTASKVYYLCLDNVNEPDDIDSLISETPNNLKILITTRNNQIDSKVQNIIQMKGMKRDEGLKCLKNYMKGLKNQKIEEIGEKVVNLLEQRGELIPLTLRAAAEFIKRWSTYSVDDILKKFVENNPYSDILYKNLFQEIKESEEHKEEW